MENNSSLNNTNTNTAAEVAFTTVEVMEKPVYPTLRVIGKTCGQAATGTIDRRLIKRVVMTLDAFDKDYVAVGGDGTAFVQVAKADETELFVEMVGGVKSLASFKFFNAYKAANKENDGVTDVFVAADSEDQAKVERALDCAARMSAAHPECDGQYKFVDKDGNRVFLRTYAPVNKNGMIA